MVDTPSTVVELGLTVAGDINTFGTAERDGLRDALRDTLGCFAPQCYISLRVSAGSVSVTAVMVIPNGAATGASTIAAATTAASVQAAATILAAQPATAVSANLGVTVESIAPAQVSQAVVPLVVAPPPPSAPPPSPAPPPPSPATPPPLAVVALSPSPPQTAPTLEAGPASLQSANQSDDSLGVVVILVAVIVVLLLVLVAIFVVWRRKRATAAKDGLQGQAVQIFMENDESNTSTSVVESKVHAELASASSATEEPVVDMDEDATFI